MPSEVLNSPQHHAHAVRANSAAHEESGGKFLTLRALIPVADAGLIIGKGGQNIQLIRDQTAAKIRLTDFVPGSQERIVSVSGSPAQVAKAFSMVSEIDPDHLNVLHFLIPHTNMGAVIGKSGSKIRELQQISHCKLVASDQLLPNSTERWVCVTSQSPKDLQTCVELLSDLVAQVSGSGLPSPGEAAQQDRGFVAYKPVSGASPVFQQGGVSVNRRSAPRHNKEHATPFADSAARASYPKDANTAFEALSIGTANFAEKNYRKKSSPTESASNSEDLEEQLINIPNDLVGAIIGKAGARISEIRKVSGAQIRILDAVEGQDTRVASVSGSRNSIGVALSLICNRMEAERRELEGIEYSDSQKLSK